MSEPVSTVAMIEMRDAQITSLRDPSVVVLDRVNWTVLPREFWVVAGPQRTGKTDLLMHAAGLMPPAEGSCRLFGCEARELDDSRVEERLRTGFVFAEGKLFNHLTIAQNIALPLQYHRNLNETDTARAIELLLELLELTPVANVRAGNAPAVWRQRAALARALVLKPELLFLDNPNGNLMVRHRLWLVSFLDQLWHGHDFFGGQPMTIVLTTDDLRAWQHPQRKFAALHEGTFSTLGAWNDDAFNQNHAVKDLLASASELQN